MTVLLSSHLLDRVQSVCDRVALFNDGKIALLGTVADLGRQVLGGGFRVEIEAEGQGLAERLEAIPGVQRVEKTGIGKLRLFADRDVRPEAAAQWSRGRPADSSAVGRGAEPRDDLHPLFREARRVKEGARHAA